MGKFTAVLLGLFNAKQFGVHNLHVLHEIYLRFLGQMCEWLVLGTITCHLSIQGYGVC